MITSLESFLIKINPEKNYFVTLILQMEATKEEG